MVKKPTRPSLRGTNLVVALSFSDLLFPKKKKKISREYNDPMLRDEGSWTTITQVIVSIQHQLRDVERARRRSVEDNQVAML